MQKPFFYKLQQQNCWLSPEKMLFWEEEKALIVSDLHFGKTGHFRKSGIAIPQSVYKQDLQRLVSQLQYFQPKKLLVVGDMFHSHENKELEWFKKWRFDFPDLSIQLIKGNHDILEAAWYKEAGVEIHDKELILPPYIFLHDLQNEPTTNNNHYLFSGHIHPGVRVSGLGKQSLRFPCFYFTAGYCVLPAFSHFTGLALIEQKAGDAVFAIVNQSIIAITC
jgi:uncharacterized protein